MSHGSNDAHRRYRLAAEVAQAHSGVATRASLIKAGITKDAIRAEIGAERWTRMGRHTVGVTPERSSERALMWRAVWESGSGSALDGVSALIVAGLTGWSEDIIHVSLPRGSRVHQVEGVRPHQPRDRGDIMSAALPRTRPEVAVIRAARWAGTDRRGGPAPTGKPRRCWP